MVRDIASRKPEIQEYFRVFIGDVYDEIRNENIRIDENMINKMMAYPFDQMFKPQVERSLFYEKVKKQRLSIKESKIAKN